MSKAAMTWAGRQRIASLPMKAVLRALAYIHREGAPLYPSQQRLSTDTGLSIRAVREALWLLGHFGLVKRTARSNGARGRTSDLFVLSMDSEFTLTANAISSARKALRKSSSNRHRAPLAENSQPAPRAGAPGTARRGIGEQQKKELSHRDITTEVEVGDTREVGPRLTLVSGGRP